MASSSSSKNNATDSKNKKKLSKFQMNGAKKLPSSSPCSSSSSSSSTVNDKYLLSTLKPSLILVLLIICALVATRWPSLNLSSFVDSSKQPTSSTLYEENSSYPKRDAYILNCTESKTSIVCPANYSPNPTLGLDDFSSNRTCPEYFRWIHEDLKNWKETGITKEVLESIQRNASFRLTIVNGTAYIHKYMEWPIDRGNFTVWGILQLLKLYPGRIPDLDLMFECFDTPIVRRDNYTGNLAPFAPPLFHYCGSQETFDIAFPDFAFWGWPELKLKPWEGMVQDLKKTNLMINWTDRKPYAFWKGNLYTGQRLKLLNCAGPVEDYNVDVVHVTWAREKRYKFKNTDVRKQCLNRYNIYIEGWAWSVGSKYIFACDAMTLLVDPIYYEFYTRSLLPLEHYWPINPDRKRICKSIKFAVDWGNNNNNKAREIGKAGSEYLLEQVKMQNVYDYMFHLLNEYAKLLKYKPTVPEGAIELCSEQFACGPMGRETTYRIESAVHEPAKEGPCNLPPPYDPDILQTLQEQNAKIKETIDMWVDNSG